MMLGTSGDHPNLILRCFKIFEISIFFDIFDIIFGEVSRNSRVDAKLFQHVWLCGFDLSHIEIFLVNSTSDLNLGILSYEGSKC